MLAWSVALTSSVFWSEQCPDLPSVLTWSVAMISPMCWPDEWPWSVALTSPVCWPDQWPWSAPCVGLITYQWPWPLTSPVCWPDQWPWPLTSPLYWPDQCLTSLMHLSDPLPNQHRASAWSVALTSPVDIIQPSESKVFLLLPTLCSKVLSSMGIALILTFLKLQNTISWEKMVRWV